MSPAGMLGMSAHHTVRIEVAIKHISITSAGTVKRALLLACFSVKGGLQALGCMALLGSQHCTCPVVRPVTFLLLRE